MASGKLNKSAAQAALDEAASLQIHKTIVSAWLQKSSSKRHRFFSFDSTAAKYSDLFDHRQIEQTRRVARFASGAK